MVILYSEGGCFDVQIIILSPYAKSKNMSNLSSEEDFNNSAEESEEVIPGRKYIKKSKTAKKKTLKLISSTYKKKRCQFYNKGACNKGSQCTFSHSFIPDVAKKICKFFLTNSCNKGEDCPYSHNTKRYPCKFYHIQQHCGVGNECRFSHQQIDPDFEEEFLKDNQDFLVKIYKQDRNLPARYLTYIQNHDLLNKQKSPQVQPPKSNINLPFIFGFQISKTVSREQKGQPPAISSRNKQISRKSSNNQHPFSIRMVQKNRTPIPQKLEANFKENLGPEQKASQQRSLKSLGSQQRNQLQPMCSQKISQGIDLTPESKSQRYCQGVQYLMYSYN